MSHCTAVGATQCNCTHVCPQPPADPQMGLLTLTDPALPDMTPKAGKASLILFHQWLHMCHVSILYRWIDLSRDTWQIVSCRYPPPTPRDVRSLAKIEVGAEVAAFRFRLLHGNNNAGAGGMRERSTTWISASAWMDGRRGGPSSKPPLSPSMQIILFQRLVRP